MKHSTLRRLSTSTPLASLDTSVYASGCVGHSQPSHKASAFAKASSDRSAGRLRRSGEINRTSSKSFLASLRSWTSLLSTLFLFAAAQAADTSVETFSQIPAPSESNAITVIRGDLSYDSHTPITINRSGVYRLSTPLSAAAGVTALTISADNVSLDLDGNTISGGATGINVTGNNVAIKNGTIQNTSAAGIIISGANCHLDGLDSVNSSTGFLVQNTNSSILTNCRALHNTSAGFSLVSTYTTQLTVCQALDTTGGNHAAYGFISQLGYGNTFAQCRAQNTQTATTNASLYAAGFLLSGEQASTITACRAQSSQSLANTSAAYGIYLDTTQQCHCTFNTVYDTHTAHLPTGLGVGIRADSSTNYVAANTAYANDISYQGIASEYITSQANARGVYNIDSHSGVPDSINTINSTVSAIGPENWSINSKCEIISSKIDSLTPLIDQQNGTIESKTEALESKVDFIIAPFMPINSKLDSLLACPFTPIMSSGTTTSNKQFITGPITIADPGYYCLAGNCSGPITLATDDATLDLNNYTITGDDNGLNITGNYNTVRNGTIVNATANGVQITGNNCMLENVEVVSTPTGFSLAQVTANQLAQCAAHDCTNNGFILSQCTYNTLSGCSVKNLRSTNTAANGFYATNGQHNLFDGCSANTLATSAANATAQGFRLESENYSTVTNCTVNGISTTQGATNLYGMYVPTTQTQNLTYTDPDLNTTAGNSVAWLESAGNRYVAVGCSAGANQEIQVLKYTGALLTRAASAPWPTTGTAVAVNSVDWLTINGTMYLAIVANSTTGGNVAVYQFTAPSTLTKIITYVAGGSFDTYAVSWLTDSPSPNGYYLAIGTVSAGGATMRLFEFNPSTPSITQISYTNTTNICNSVDWITIRGINYLAAGVAGTSPSIRIYTPIGTAALWPYIASISGTSNVKSVRWLATNSGKYYLATGEVSTGNNPNVRIFQWDPTANILTQIASYQYGTNTSTVNSVSWLPGVDGLNLLAIAGDYATNEMQVLRFDGQCLTPIYTYADPDATSALSVDWLTTGSTILALGVDGTNSITVRTLGFSPARNTFSSNTVSNVHGGASATAFAIDPYQYMTNNLATNNDTNYYYTPIAGDSNQGY